MNWRRIWPIGLAIATWIALVGFANLIHGEWPSLAQSPPPEQMAVPVEAIPVDPSLPANRPPVPMSSPKPSPSAKPKPGAKNPSSPLFNAPLPAAPTAPPLPIAQLYQDPQGRFQVGLLQGYKLTALVDSILVESADGNLAYTVQVVPQAQLGLAGGLMSNDALVKVVQNTFGQGEGFATGELHSIPGGVQMDWTGDLTIASASQPVGGVVLVRQNKGKVLLLLIAATQAGGSQVLGAASALVNGFQAL